MCLWKCAKGELTSEAREQRIWACCWAAEEAALPSCACKLPQDRGQSAVCNPNLLLNLHD